MFDRVVLCITACAKTLEQVDLVIYHWQGQQQQLLYAPLCAGETACNRLFRCLQQMEMRAASSARPWVSPPSDDFRISHDLIIQQEYGYIGELLEQVIANFPGQALPFVGIISPALLMPSRSARANSFRGCKFSSYSPVSKLAMIDPPKRA